ncbi:MAG: methylmalonyl Co-A mutase-associated GTPase MeaB [Deltaproteobacteria bacterium]|nr:methylmalonyl Co-A mutase-associated GTPase MeaB [Deltaproteobacteria bacterium]MBW2073334.1 methylmalonyl Co-A mutase-associated GTPase MeaB [Deltaproteobacteria bacterium]RLB83193.1 MAG: methylmalonyl Co-A mutase-associated GTPase MeaB [Deltaproteobacteria bacterium]
MERVEKILAGDIRTAAKLIRDIDDGIPSSREVLKALYPHTGRAYVVGISGFPGVGKSTLVDQMIQAYREAGKSLGVLAVDPTSPFSGGAILGDRIRMQRHGTDPDVFIRSLATRGHFGGLTRSTRSVIDVLDAMGKDIILVETVGVGQDEVDIVTTAHTTIIVLIPGMGDDIQAIKAGILEVADIFVVNKADREGLEKTMNDLRVMLDMNNAQGNAEEVWRPPIVATEAISNKGVAELLSEIEAHKVFLFGHGGARLREHLRQKAFRELIDTIREKFVAEVVYRLKNSEAFESMIDDLVDKRIDPFTLGDQIMAERINKCLK